jgi:hypothetical protein
MSTQPDATYDGNDDQQTDQQTDQQGGDQFRAMREKANKADSYQAAAQAAQERALAAEQRAALLEVGIKPDSAQGKKLLRLHDGDWTAEALRGTATEYGEELPGGVPSDQEAAATRMEEVGQGAEHTSGASDVQAELDKLPQWGDPNFHAGKKALLDLVERHGGEINRERAAAPTWINPFTKQRMATHQPGTPAPRADINAPRA